MKIRLDFVSNSSSCSLVLRNPRETKQLPEDVFKMLLGCKCLEIVSKEGFFPESIKQKAAEAGFRLGAKDDEDEPEWMYGFFDEDNCFSRKAVSLDSAFLKQLFENSSSVKICVSYDTCGDAAERATALARAFDEELGAEVDSSGCDHWGYCSQRQKKISRS